MQQDERIDRRLYLDPARRRIVGVCAGIARYYGVEPWVVRLIAVTALLFFPGIIFPAYWVAYFVMERPPRAGRDSGMHRGGMPGARAHMPSTIATHTALQRRSSGRGSRRATICAT
jgi:phage shock protein PspC (stress-responsive transcriptional regulator)